MTNKVSISRMNFQEEVIAAVNDDDSFNRITEDEDAEDQLLLMEDIAKPDLLEEIKSHFSRRWGVRK